MAEQETQNFLEDTRNMFRKTRKPLLFALFMLLGVAFFIDNINLKISTIGSLFMVILFVIFSLYDTILLELRSIKANLESPKPPEFRNFAALEQPLLDHVILLARQQKEIRIQIIAVSAKYSWQFLGEHMSRIVAASNGKCKVDIELALVHGETLRQHQQTSWLRHLETTHEEIQRFRHRYLKELDRGAINLRVYHYDDLPHWHGLLIDGKQFYMGRTEWIFSEGDVFYPELYVGQIEYRLFTLDDRFGGSERIRRFENWLRYYRHRSNFLAQ